MQKILISSCLLGEKVRFDGKSKKINAKILRKWQTENRLVMLCPEVAGGLSVPRPPAEIQGISIVTLAGDDVTHAFVQGAQKALEVCQQHDIHIAILKEGSPSCGVTEINDGTFSHTKVVGQGITARLLQAYGIKVFSEHQLEEAQVYLQNTL